MFHILVVTLISVLALPVAVMTQPATASTRAEATVSAAPQADQLFGAPLTAEARKSKKGKKDRPKFRTVTRTIRQPLTRTFTNPARIGVPLDQAEADL